MVSSTLRRHLTSRKDPVPILQDAGWTPGPVWKGGKSRPYRDSITDRPARSQSLYRMSYPAHFHRGADGSSSFLRCYVLSFGKWLDYLPLKEKTLHSSDTSGTTHPITHPRRRESSLPYLPTYSALFLSFTLYRDVLSSIVSKPDIFFCPASLTSDKERQDKNLIIAGCDLCN